MIKPDFERDAYPTFRMEGVYDNDPDDPGAETFRAIARAYNPHFVGWVTIDEIKAQLVDKSKRAITTALQNHIVLENQAKEFLKGKYWNPLLLDQMPHSAIAEELFDQNIHLPPGQAVKHLQESLNVLNRSYDKKLELFPDLVEDGLMGKKTLTAMKIYFFKEKNFEEALHLLLVLLNGRQIDYYYRGMKKSPIKEKYARGFFKRCYIEKGKDHGPIYTN